MDIFIKIDEKSYLRALHLRLQFTVIIYNRLINSSQTNVVFSGLPLRAIEDMDCFIFLKQYIPDTKHDFTIKTSTIKTPEKYYMGLSELTFSRLIINEE